jgi:ABC-type polysaccharide/polyol phosphate export permease
MVATIENTATLSLDRQNEVVFYKIDQNKLAMKDFLDGFKEWRIWLTLALQDIKLRYRRSVLGPFWITLSMAITAYSMGYLYSHLFHTDLQSYFPFLVAGMLAWSFISSTITELVDTLVMEEGMIKQIKLPYCLYINKVIARNFIIFLHNIPILLPIIALFHETAKINLCTLMLIPGLLLIYLNGLTYGLTLAMLGARFRDISQIIKSLIQVVFFVTPVMWSPDILPPAKRFIATLNPFYAFIEFIRDPLIGKVPSLTSWLIVFAVTLLGFFISFKLFSRYRSRIVYWL